MYKNRSLLLSLLLFALINACAEPHSDLPSETSDLLKLENFWVEIGSKDSFLLREKDTETSDVSGRANQFCALYKRSRYKLYAKPVAAGDGFVEINVVDYTKKGCGFSKGYARVSDISSMSHDSQSGRSNTSNFFPLAHRPKRDYTSAPRKFGSFRSGGSRLHAGADLYSSTHQNVKAIADGRILDYYYFYSGTYAVVVSHPTATGTKVVRYGEVGALAPGVRVGQTVIRGQSLAKVGRLNCCHPMLHFEAFSGERSGPLTGGGRYQRRSDLVNPTKTLQLMQAAAGL